MAESTFALEAPGLAKLTAQLAALLTQGADVRGMQAKNAPQASNFDQQGLQGVGGITGDTIYTIAEAQSAAKNFYQAVFTFDAGSGAGRYHLTGAAPTPAIGIPIPAGGVVLVITGANNIRAFKMIAEAGQILTFARVLFT